MGTFSQQYQALTLNNIRSVTRNKRTFLLIFFFPILFGGFCYWEGRDIPYQYFITAYLPYIVGICFIPLQRIVLISTVYERMEGTKDLLKAMGMQNWVYLFTQITFTYILSGIQLAIQLVMGFLFLELNPNNEGWGNVSTSAIIIFVILSIIYIAGLTNYTYCISLMFRSVKSAGDMGPLVVFVSSIIYLFSLTMNNTYVNIFFFLIPQTPFMDLFFKYIKGESVAMNIVYIIFNAFFYLALYMYLDQIVPNQHGVAKKWNYLFKKNTGDSSKNEQVLPLLNDNQGSAETQCSAFFRDLNDGKKLDSKVVLQIKSVSKVFENEVRAVDNVSLEVVNKEIFGLLGHNGAGKTTLLNILTGVVAPTSGTCFINNKNIIDSPELISKEIGYCPQTDILFDFLTVDEHLTMISKIKNIPADTIQADIANIKQATKLTDHSSKLATQLSGGLKRRLCLSMAMIGNPSILFLDEPSSGLDPQSRCEFWQVLEKLKNNHAIILTTHHLDEAEKLSDRVGIMCAGHLLVVGTKDYINKTFGEGYNLSITLVDESSIDATKGEIHSVILKHIPDAKKNPTTARNVATYMLPFKDRDKYAELFKILENNSNVQLNIKNVTLEDAFISIGINEKEFLQKHQQENESPTVKLPMEENETKQKVVVDLENLDKFFTFSGKSSWLSGATFTFKKRFNLIRTDIRALLFITFPFILALFVSLCVSIKFLSYVLKIFPDAIPPKQIFLVYFIIAIGILFFFFLFNSSSFALDPVIERENGMRHLQRMMGCSSGAFFAGQYLADIIVFGVVGVLYFWVNFIVFIIFHGVAGVSGNGLFILESNILIIIFGMIIFANGYLASAFFDNYRLALGINFLLILIFLYTIPILCAVFIPSPTGYYIGFYSPIMPLFFAFMEMLDQAYNIQTFNTIFGFWNAPFSILLSILFVFLSALIEDLKYKKIMPISETPNQVSIQLNENVTANQGFYADESVQNEIEAVKSDQSSQKTYIKAQNISKNYKSFPALSGISFQVEKDQIFGLLGPNGAGKSTTFNILTSLLQRSSGKITIDQKNFDDQNEMKKVYLTTGFTSQNNIMFPTLTVEQHLLLFSGLKGYTKLEAEYSINFILNLLDMNSYRKRKAMALSGGNKRKLCVAISILTNPKLLFLDEPSTGVDAISRRALWNTIMVSKSANKSCCILTTHVMAEAESLCQKIGMLINGRFACIGDLNTLKKNFSGSGFYITINLNKAKLLQPRQIAPATEGPISILAEEEERIRQLLEKEIGKIQKMDSGKSPEEAICMFKISIDSIRFSQFFETCSRLQDKKEIEDYSITSSSLEDLFLYYCRFQKDLNKKDADENARYLRVKLQNKQRKNFKQKCFSLMQICTNTIIN